MMKRALTVLFTGALLLLTPFFVACAGTAPATTNAPQISTVSQPTAVLAPVLTDIHSPDDLKVRFNQDDGVPRIILLLSPT